MRALLIPALAAAACAAVLSGCGEKNDTTGSASTAPQQSSAPEPAVAFVKPKDGADVSGAVLCRVKLTNFTIDAKAVGQSPVPNRGHLHFSVDDGKFDYPKYSGPNGQLAAKLDVDGKYSPSVTPAIAYRHLPKGKHKVEVYLANNNHTNIGPEAEAEITVK